MKSTVISPKFYDTAVFDVDGTLLDSHHQLPPSTETAIRCLIEAGVFVMLATGKTYESTRGLRSRLKLKSIGVYSQGLAICDQYGSIIEQVLLTPSIVQACAELSKNGDLDLVAYSGSQLLTSCLTDRTNQMVDYHEPIPIFSPDVAQEPVNKILLIADQPVLDKLRLQLEPLWRNQATLVQAVPDMLEVVPLNTSKGATVARVLEEMGRSAENTMAFGDGENDIEMLRWAGLGVAMGNGGENVQMAADFVTKGNDEDGVAHAIGQCWKNSLGNI